MSAPTAESLKWAARICQRVIWSSDPKNSHYRCKDCRTIALQLDALREEIAVAIEADFRFHGREHHDALKSAVAIARGKGKT